MELHPLIRTLSECLIVTGEQSGCLHPGSRQDRVPAAPTVLPKEEPGVHPCRRISASHPGDEPGNGVCHLLAGLKWKVLVTAGETATNSAKKSLQAHRLELIQAEERKKKQNMPFHTRLRRAWLLRFRIMAHHHSCSAGSGATGVPSDGGWRVPGVLTQPTPAILFSQGLSSTHSGLCFFLARGHFLSMPGSCPQMMLLLPWRHSLLK